MRVFDITVQQSPSPSKSSDDVFDMFSKKKFSNYLWSASLATGRSRMCHCTVVGMLLLLLIRVQQRRNRSTKPTLSGVETATEAATLQPGYSLILARPRRPFSFKHVSKSIDGGAHIGRKSDDIYRQE